MHDGKTKKIKLNVRQIRHKVVNISKTTIGSIIVKMFFKTNKVGKKNKKQQIKINNT